jgi:hypothetical protein
MWRIPGTTILSMLLRLDYKEKFLYNSRFLVTTMGGLLKKALIGGAIILATAIPVFGSQNSAKESKLERVVMLSKSDPFIETPYKISEAEQLRIQKLDELSIRLPKDLTSYGITRGELLGYYANKNFRLHRSIGYNFIRNPELSAMKREITHEQYKQKIGFEAKVFRGVQFFKDNLLTLLDAEEKFGVSAFNIVSTIGIESSYRVNPGGYLALNAAISLYPTPKQEFAYKELKELLIFCKKNNIPIFDINSSYAICSGPGQFLPSNLNKLFQGDIFSMEDWIYAVARYLQRAGWDPKQNRKMPAKDSANWRALHDYNPSDEYVLTNSELAQAIRLQLKGKKK